MHTKLIEIRDDATCIPALAIKMEAANEIEDRFLWRCGYPRDGSSVVLMHLSTQEASSDAYFWNARTMKWAHIWLYAHFDEINEGDVLDVRVVRGMTETPAEPEIWTEVKAASHA